MTNPLQCRGSARWWAIFCLLGCQMDANAHGGVFLEDDVCVIQIGFLKAHFTVFQPRSRQGEEFCEDLPDVAETLFVLKYMHDGLAQMPIDFRIIKDVTKLGRFAKWEDVARIKDLEAETVFYQPAAIEPDVFAVVNEFQQSGNYIGIITARQLTTDRIYTAVFPFQVGATSFGYVPLFAGLLILIQVNYWIMSGGWSRWRSKRSNAPAAKPST